MEINNNPGYGRLNSNRINLNEYYEIEYWTKTLNTTIESLKIAVKQVGASVDDVRNYLRK